MKNLDHTLKAIILVLLGIGATALLPAHNASATTTIQKSDYQQTSFSRVIDFYDYVRQYATENGITPPSTTEHADLYTNYVNLQGFPLVYVGLVNATHNARYVNIAMQTYCDHSNNPKCQDSI